MSCSEVAELESFVTRYDQHQDRLKTDRSSLESNGVSSILRQANNRFRRDERAMDEDEELWFNDDDCEDETVPDPAVTSETVTGEPGDSGEPDKHVNNCDKILDVGSVVTGQDTSASTVTAVAVPTIDKLMEEDKKKELLKGVDIDSGSTEGTAAGMNGAKKSLALVDYNDSDEDEGESKSDKSQTHPHDSFLSENGASSDEDLPPSKRLKT